MTRVHQRVGRIPIPPTRSLVDSWDPNTPALTAREKEKTVSYFYLFPPTRLNQHHQNLVREYIRARAPKRARMSRRYRGSLPKLWI